MKFAALALVLVAASASSAAAAPVLWSVADGGNGHYYNWVNESVTWDAARAAAAAASHLGMPGYLATVTSEAEQMFILRNVTSATSWLGGTDRGTEGVWKWETGPEAGEIFFGPGAGAGAYSIWNPGEPNDCCGGEDELVFAWGGSGSWNDIGTPAFPNYAVPYIVEFGGDRDGGGDDGDVPEPSSMLLVAAGVLGAARRWMRK